MVKFGIKLIMIVLGILFIPSAAFATGNGLLEDMWVHYNLDALAGSAVTSTTGDMDGTLTCGSGSCQGVAGILDYGYNFAGTDSIIATSAHPYLNLANTITLNDYSVQAWIKPSSTPAYHAFFSQGHYLSGGAWMGLSNAAGIRVHTGSSGYCDTAAGVVTLNQWNHVVVSYSTTGVTIYVDGSAVPCTQSGSLVGLSNTDRPMAWGFYDNPTGSPTNYFLGDMDELAAWTKALTSAEVTELYNAGAALSYDNMQPSPATVTGYYKFEELSGDAEDSVTTNTKTTLNVAYDQTGIIDKSFGYDGAMQARVNMNNYPLTNQDEWGNCQWVYTTGPKAWRNVWRGQQGTGISIALQRTGDASGTYSDTWRYVWYDGGIRMESVGGSVNLNQWDQVCTANYGGMTRVYQNGVAISTDSIASLYTVPSWSNGLTVGMRPDTQTELFSGDIDEMVFWNNKGVSPAVVKYLYNGGAPAAPQQYPFTAASPAPGPSPGTNSTGINNLIGNVENFNTALIYDSDQKTFNYTYNDTDNTMNRTELQIFFFNGTQYEYFSTTYNSTNPGEIIANVSTLADANHTMRAFAYLTDYNRTWIGNTNTGLVATLTVYGPAFLDYLVYQIQNNEGTFWAALIIGSMAIMAAVNPAVSIFFGIAGIFLLSQLGLMRFNMSTIVLIAIWGMINIFAMGGRR